MDAEQRALLPCPFCGGGESSVSESKMWTGMRSVVISARVTHWCPRQDGQPQSVFQVAGKTREDAITAWNTRALTQARPGWRVVPVEPTDEQVNALAALKLRRINQFARGEDGPGIAEALREEYAAWLAAAPASQQEKGCEHKFAHDQDHPGNWCCQKCGKVTDQQGDKKDEQ